jgi:hypothetical protein
MLVKDVRSIIDNLPNTDKLYVGDYPGTINHKIGIDPEEKYLTLLIYGSNPNQFELTQGGGKYLQIKYDVPCTIYDSSGVKTNQNYTILTLKSREKDVEDYFIELCTLLLQRLGNSPKVEEVKLEYEKLESIFIKLSKNSKKSIVGVWGELFLIESSKDPEYFIDCWHKTPKDLFDFNNGSDRVEVKTTTQKRRNHSFEIKQLAQIPGSQTLIASIQTIEIDNGVSILNLINLIKPKVKTNYFEHLIEKTFDVLGDKLQDSFDTYYDYTVAKGNLRYFDAGLIPKPELIPSEVTNVKFTVSLENVKNFDQRKNSNTLFNKLPTCLFD